jgi:MraZ protein
MGKGGLRWPFFPEDDMFRGANKVTLDSKGRLAMPTRYRERIVERSNGRLIATVNWQPADRCLLIYPLPEWEEAELKLSRLPTQHPASRWIQRLMIGHAADLDLDANGRILIPPGLREYAQLSRTAMLIGQGNKFELWDEAQWNEKREAWLQADESAEELPPELASLSL